MKKSQTEIVAEVAAATGVSRTVVRSVIEATAKSIQEAVKVGGEARLNDLGVFTGVHVPERQGRNPATGEPMTIKARLNPRFKASKVMRDAMKA